MIDIKGFLVNILKEKIDSDISLSTGQQNEKVEKSLFISNDVKQESLKLFNQSYFKQNISITIHWNKSYTETRNKILDIYNILKNLEPTQYDENIVIIRCKMEDDFPMDAFSNTSTIYSQKFNFQVQYMNFGNN